MAKPEAQIDKLFDAHKKHLTEQKKRLTQDLEQWSRERMDEIKAHVAAETKCLEEQFQIQKKSLDLRRQKYVENMTKLKTVIDKEQIEGLLKEVKDLIFQLDTFKQTRQIEFLQISTEKRVNGKNSNENSGEDHNEKQSQKTSADGNTTTSGSSANVTEKSSPKRTSASPEQSDHQSSALNHSKAEDPQVTSDSAYGDDASHKCPVCYMIFSHLMEKTDRERHVNEHYDDD